MILWLFSRRRGHPCGGRRVRPLRLEALEGRQLLDAAGWLPALEAGQPEGEAPPLPNFALVDVNATSPTYNQSVSPRDYLQQVSAWYYGRAT